jgi:hypothetical protein
MSAAPIRSMACVRCGVDSSNRNRLHRWRRCVIVVKESNTGLGMQLRLVAGPLNDAAAAAKICAALIESQRTCETAVFDGQRLAMKADEPAASTKPAAAKPAVRRRRVTTNENPPKGSPPSMLSSVFGGR